MRNLRPLARSLLLVPLLPIAALRAQQLSEVAPGARVRIQAPGVVAGRYTGTVLSRTADTIVVASGPNATVRVPVSSLTSVEVSRGKSRSRGALKGVAWGAGIGLAAGFLVAAAGSEDYATDESDGELVASGVLGGVFWGAIIGAIAGSERWDRYTLPTRTSLLLPAAPGRVAVGLRIAVGR